MGTKRLGLARVEALLEAQDRALAMGGSDLTVETLTADNGVTATAGGLTATAGGLTITAGKKICGIETVAAAGSNQGTGTAVTCSHPFVAVTGADGSKGVTLAVVSGLTAGTIIKIFNYAASALEVYPGSGDRIYPASDDAGITVAAYGFLELMVYDATGWVGNEGVIAA